MKKYIDFDSVILDTAPVLFKEWLEENDEINTRESEKIAYINSQPWDKILLESNIINDSIYYLKNIDPKRSAILTKIHSLENEGMAKIRYLRNAGVKQEVILVPYYLDKTDVVDAYKNILVDDSVYNCDKWLSCGGYPIFFNKDNIDMDEWKVHNTDHPKIRTLKNIDYAYRKKYIKK